VPRVASFRGVLRWVKAADSAPASAGRLRSSATRPCPVRVIPDGSDVTDTSLDQSSPPPASRMRTGWLLTSREAVKLVARGRHTDDSPSHRTLPGLVTAQGETLLANCYDYNTDKIKCRRRVPT